MGTSKGYIQPTREPWTQSKKAVTQLLKSHSGSSIPKATSKFATAMKSDMKDGMSFAHATANLMGLSKHIASHGLETALREIDRLDLLDKDTDQIWEELLLFYTNNGSSTEDSLAIDALSLALKILKIESLEKLGEVKQDVLLKEILIDYISISFEFRYKEKISKNRRPAEADQIIKSIQNYIRSNLYEDLSFDDIESIDFGKLTGNAYVESALRAAYTLFEQLYFEE